MTFVFLHGLAGDPDDFLPVAKHLQSHRLIAPRIPYFDDDLTSIADLAGMIAPEILRSNPCDHATLVGNSLGGTLALALADSFPHATIALVGSHISTSNRPVNRTGNAFNRELSFIFHNQAVLSENRKRRYQQKWMDFTTSRQGIRRLRVLKSIASTFDFRAHFERLQHKITLICGRNDQISPLHEFTTLLSRHNGMKLHIINECGHAIPLEHPACLARILTFSFS